MRPEKFNDKHAKIVSFIETEKVFTVLIPEY